MTHSKVGGVAALGFIVGSVALACSGSETPNSVTAPVNGAGTAGTAVAAAGAAGSGAGGTVASTPGGGAGGVGDAPAGMSNVSGGGVGGAVAGAGGLAAGGAGAAGEGGSAGASTEDCDPGNICDGFEAYTPGGGYGEWTQNGTDGEMGVDTTHVFSGEQSMHFRIDAGEFKTLELMREGAPIFPAKNNTFWGRVMVYATDIPKNRVHFDVVHASGENFKEGYFLSGMPGSRLIYQPHDCYVETQNEIPEGQWACWQWLFDGENNILEFYIDGDLDVRVEGTGQGCVDGTNSVWEAPEFSKIGIGWINYQPKDAVNDIWLDDFAVGPERIECPEPGANMR